MIPVWLTAVAWLYLLVCFSCMGVIAYDIAVNRRRQPIGSDEFVFPITALYFGPLALAMYLRWGRAAVRAATPPMIRSLAAVSRAPAASSGNGIQMPGHAPHDMADATPTPRTPARGSAPPRQTTSVPHRCRSGPAPATGNAATL